jgi:catalase (peroxidase I)
MSTARDEHPGLDWADVIAVAGAVAVERCGGPVIMVGLGRQDATEPLDYPLPHEDIDVEDLRGEFSRRGFSDEAVARARRDAHLTLLAADRALAAHPELRAHVERFAQDEPAFFAAFADAYVRLTWLGQTRPGA